MARTRRSRRTSVSVTLRVRSLPISAVALPAGNATASSAAAALPHSRTSSDRGPSGVRNDATRTPRARRSTTMGNTAHRSCVPAGREGSGSGASTTSRVARASFTAGASRSRDDWADERTSSLSATTWETSDSPVTETMATVSAPMAWAMCRAASCRCTSSLPAASASAALVRPSPSTRRESKVITNATVSARGRWRKREAACWPRRSRPPTPA